MAAEEVSYLFAFIASFIYIWAKATQQLQVVNFRYMRIMPISIVMGFCEVFIMVNVIRTSESFGGLVLLALCIGLGAGLGCLSAMRLYRK
jgi:carbon starvation protein CstA